MAHSEAERHNETPNDSPWYDVEEAALHEAEKLAGRWANHMDSLKNASSRDVVTFLGDNVEGYQELIRIKTELATSIALCEEHDRRTRPNRLEGSRVSDGAKDQKLWLPSMAEYRRGEMEGKAASIGSDPGGG
jgi:hypothetical protein